MHRILFRGHFPIQMNLLKLSHLARGAWRASGLLPIPHRWRRICFIVPPKKLSKLTGSNNLYLDSSVLCNRQIAYKNVAIREKLPLLLPSSTQNYNIVSKKKKCVKNLDVVALQDILWGQK